MPGPLPKAVAKKVKGTLGSKAKTMPITHGKNYKPPKAVLMPSKTRKKMTRDYKFIESESYQTRKRANKKRAGLGMKPKPGRY